MTIASLALMRLFAAILSAVEPGDIAVALVAATGGLLGGLGAYQSSRAQKQGSALDALKLALDTFTTDNGGLRGRIAVLEVEVERCEEQKREQAQQIALHERTISQQQRTITTMESRIARLEGGQQ